MSKTLLHTTVGYTVLDVEDLPPRDGEPMDENDVAAEIGSVITAALASWYHERGHELLACEPIVT